MTESGDYIKPEKDRYIKLSQALEVLDSCACWWAHDRMECIPAANVVEVVRCKDCKYSEHWYRGKRLCRLWYGEEKPAAPIDVFDDGFCNYGERREEDD